MRIRAGKFIVSDEMIYREPKLAAEIVQKSIANEAGHVVERILLEEGIEKGSPIYIDVPRQGKDPRTMVHEFELEVKYFPATFVPQRASLTQHPDVKQTPINTRNQKGISDGRPD